MPRAAAKPRRTQTIRTKITWREWTLEVRYTSNYLSHGQDHIEVKVKTPKGAPIPITATGYRPHFIDADLLEAAGGPKAYVLHWLDQEARSKAWSTMEATWRQLELELVFPKASRARKLAAHKPARKPQP